MHKKKLLFVISNLNIGGPQKSLLALLDLFDYEKFEIDVISISPNGTLFEQFNTKANIINADPLVTALTIPKNNLLHYLLLLLKKKQPRLLFDIIIAIIKHVIFRKNMTHLRQKLWYKYRSILPKIKKKYDGAFGILGFSTYFISDLVEAKTKYHWIRSDITILDRDFQLDDLYYRKMNGFIAVSYQTAEIFSKEFTYSKNNMNVLYNRIPLKFYSQQYYDKALMDTSKFKILTISRLVPLKGIELAIETCSLLKETNLNFKWFVIGDGFAKNDYKQLINQHNLESDFILLGFQKNTLAFIKDADIIVHPSYSEGKSNAIDEAQFIGKPIVATNFNTVSEQITDNFDGLIADFSAYDICSKILSIANSSTLRERLINNCKEKKNKQIDINIFFQELIEGNHEKTIE